MKSLLRQSPAEYSKTQTQPAGDDCENLLVGMQAHAKLHALRRKGKGLMKELEQPDYHYAVRRQRREEQAKRRGTARRQKQQLLGAIPVAEAASTQEKQRDMGPTVLSEWLLEGATVAMQAPRPGMVPFTTLKPSTSTASTASDLSDEQQEQPQQRQLVSCENTAAEWLAYNSSPKRVTMPSKAAQIKEWQFAQKYLVSPEPIKVDLLRRDAEAYEGPWRVPDHVLHL